MDAEKKSFSTPDETRQFDNGQMEIVKIAGGAVGRATFKPGWKWSNDVKPIAGTELCEARHLQYMVSGRMKIVMKDDTELELGPGDAAAIPPGHDGWVVGDEDAVLIDWGGAANYATK